MLKDAHVSVYSEFLEYFSIAILNIKATHFLFLISPPLPHPKTKIKVSLKICRKKTCLSLKHGQTEIEII